MIKTIMAEEQEPLLVNVQTTAKDVIEQTPRQQVQQLYESGNVLGKHSPYRGENGGNINLIISSGSSQNLAECDQIVAIFVVAFDTKAGNVIEWCVPEDIDLEGIEFKAMASGSHTLQKDFVYFRKGNLFGLACFENMPVESEIERGARMKSVGILSTSYTLLYKHMQFLESQVRHLLEQIEERSGIESACTPGESSRHQLEIPGRYGQLKAFWDDKKGTLSASDSRHNLSVPTGSSASTPSDSILPEMKVTHPAGCFSQFIKFFGVQIFTLWKYALLGKRILFFSPPPIGVVCHRVYCACCLANHSMQNSIGAQYLQPHFYVNVADIDSLETEGSYVACTTEKIFETKTHLYDVYVDNQNVSSHIPALKELLRISDADRDKITKLNNQRSQQMFACEEGSDSYLNEEEVFTTFFTEQNNRLFQTLIDVSASMDRQLTSDHMKSMGLDPVGDRSFLMELVETYGIDVMLMVDNPCCPR